MFHSLNRIEPGGATIARREVITLTMDSWPSTRGRAVEESEWRRMNVIAHIVSSCYAKPALAWELMAKKMYCVLRTAGATACTRVLLLTVSGFKLNSYIIT